MSDGPVLVVDDDPAIRQAVRDVLEDRGIEVETATDGADALAKLAPRPPCLILLDMRMPVMDGWTFARELSARNISLPVVVMTAAADAGRWAAEIGAVGVMPKPFAIDELIGAVERYGT